MLEGVLNNIKKSGYSHQRLGGGVYVFKYEFAEPIRSIYARKKEHISEAVQIMLDPSHQLPAPVDPPYRRVPGLKEIMEEKQGCIRFDFWSGAVMQDSYAHPLRFPAGEDCVVEVLPEELLRFQDYAPRMETLHVGNLYMIQVTPFLYSLVPEDIVTKIKTIDVSKSYAESLLAHTRVSKGLKQAGMLRTGRDWMISSQGLLMPSLPPEPHQEQDS